jgi:Flp pilus assembly protein TadG
MRPWRRSADLLRGFLRRIRREDGSASLEFITVGLLLLVPVVYLVLALSALEKASFGVEGAARQATRVFVQSGSEREAEAAAQTAIAVTLADYGLAARDARVQVSCRPNPSDCLTRRGFVTVSIEVTVPLPLIPPVLTLHLPTGIPVHSVATEQVSRFWSSS